MEETNGDPDNVATKGKRPAPKRLFSKKKKTKNALFVDTLVVISTDTCELALAKNYNNAIDVAKDSQAQKFC